MQGIHSMDRVRAIKKYAANSDGRRRDFSTSPPRRLASSPLGGGAFFPSHPLYPIRNDLSHFERFSLYVHQLSHFDFYLLDFSIADFRPFYFAAREFCHSNDVIKNDGNFSRNSAPRNEHRPLQAIADLNTAHITIRWRETVLVSFPFSLIL